MRQREHKATPRVRRTTGTNTYRLLVFDGVERFGEVHPDLMHNEGGNVEIAAV